MKWLENFLEKYPEIKSQYEKEAAEWIRDKKSQLKHEVPEHRWWEIDDIDAMNINLPPTEEARLREWALHCAIIGKMDNEGMHSSKLRKVLDDLEEVAVSLEDYEKREMEVLLIEGLINRTNTHNTYDQFYSILGPALRQMCDHNNAFWMQLGKQKEKS